MSSSSIGRSDRRLMTSASTPKCSSSLAASTQMPTVRARDTMVTCLPTATHSCSDPSTVQKNTGRFAGHVRKKYRIFDRTSEAYFATLVRHYGISEYSKSSNVGIYWAGTLLPEIIVILFPQNCTFCTVMYVSYIFLSISHSATVDRNQLV